MITSVIAQVIGTIQAARHRIEKSYGAQLYFGMSTPQGNVCGEYEDDTQPHGSFLLNGTSGGFAILLSSRALVPLAHTPTADVAKWTWVDVELAALTGGFSLRASCRTLGFASAVLVELLLACLIAKLGWPPLEDNVQFSESDKPRPLSLGKLLFASCGATTRSQSASIQALCQCCRVHANCNGGKLPNSAQQMLRVCDADRCMRGAPVSRPVPLNRIALWYG